LTCKPIFLRFKQKLIENFYSEEGSMTIADEQDIPKVQIREAKSIAWEQFRSNPAGIISAVVLCIFLFLAIFGYQLLTHGPHASVGDTFQPPSLEHLMGTDHLARDVLSRFIAGVRISLMVGMGAASISLVVGVIVGATVGFLGGVVDVILMRFADIVLTIPMIVLGMALAAFLGTSVTNMVLIIAFLSWPRSARIVRSEFLSIRERDFVLAAEAVGSSTWWIVFREILPNAIPAILVNWSYEVGRAIILEAGLSFLGMGDPEAGSWGVMLHDAQRFLRRAWWMSVFPGLGIAITVISTNVLGETLNDALNPKLQDR
jgi:peptide/nickel transport system permease protein